MAWLQLNKNKVVLWHAFTDLKTEGSFSLKPDEITSEAIATKS